MKSALFFRLHHVPLGALLIAAVSTLLVVDSATARDVAGLYSARVDVADRSAPELRRGASAALAQVLVKLTGQRGMASAEATRDLRARASRLLLKYAYESSPGVDGLRLSADFDPAVVEAEMRKQGLPVWGKERPETLVWLIVDDQAGRNLSSSDEPGLAGEALGMRAMHRGIPVLLPVADIEESQHLNFAADWDTLSTTTVALSERYGTPSNLVGYFRQSVPGFWEVQWRLDAGGESFAWRQEGDLFDLLLEEGVDVVADALARRFADPGMLAVAERTELRIRGLSSAADYARVQNYLGALDTVDSLFVRRVDDATLTVEVTAQGGAAALSQSIAFGNVLQPSSNQSLSGQAAANRALVYELAR